MIRRTTRIHNWAAVQAARQRATVVPARKGKGTNNKRKEDRKDAFKYQENADKKGE
jgi:hypothetical protein|tara:strand:+ start:869 stop:1036 length:168 start_codon:yes stop_codon:yes gene_type:complete